MKINPSLTRLNSNSKIKNLKHNNIANKNTYAQLPIAMSYPKNYYNISFEARVEKDLDSFVERNASNLPDSVKYYVENLTPEQKQTITPLEAQRNAFEYITLCDSVDEVKEMYPTEPLFANLIPSTQSKATRGILFDIRFLKDALKAENQTVINSSNEDISIYLVKKIFLEGKTIPEINEDLDKDINPALKREDKNYILPSTLKALGIALPTVAYLNSLRYTKAGYSDNMALKMSQHWKNLTDEQKEKIINSHSSPTGRKLSQEQKEKLSKLTKARWEKMTPEQKVDLINKLQQGNKEQKIIMISAWNKCPELRMKLSQYLYENNCFSPQNVIYADKPLSEAMSHVMLKFWQLNQDGANEFGEAIIKSRDEFNQAKKLGNEEKYIEDTLQAQKENKIKIKSLKANRKAKVSHIQNAKPIVKSQREKLYDEYKEDFSFFPEECFKEHFEKLDNFSVDDVKKYIAFLKNEKMSDEDANVAKKVSEAIFSKTGTTCIITDLFIATICPAMLTQALEPIVNSSTGQEYKINFPMFTGANAAFVMTSRLCYYLSHNSVEEFNLVDWLKTQNNIDEKINSPLDDAYAHKLIKSYSKNPAKVEEVLQNYKYKFKTIPDVQSFKDECNLNILNTVNTLDSCRPIVKKHIIKLAGYNNLTQKDFEEFDKLLPADVNMLYTLCFSQNNLPTFSMLYNMTTISIDILKKAMIGAIKSEFKKLDSVCQS